MIDPNSLTPEDLRFTAEVRRIMLRIKLGADISDEDPLLVVAAEILLQDDPI